MQLVKVNDGDGHWVEDGELMTTVWSSEGWLDLPDKYPFEGYVTEEELEQIDPNDDDINLGLKIHYQNRLIKVMHVDFSFVETPC